MLVSIYIPTRNRAGSLRRAVESALCQSHREIEIIVVDDGSTDTTQEVLRQLSAGDQRLKWSSNYVRCGAPVCRNQAIRSSRGAFVTGLDDDDAFTSERIEKFVEHWKRVSRSDQPVSALYSQDVFTRRDGTRRLTEKPEFVSATDMFEQNRLGSQIFAPRESYLAAGLFDPDMPAWQDLEFFIRFLLINGRAGLVPCATYEYDDADRGDRISTKHDRLRLACRMVIARHRHLTPGAEQKLVMQLVRNYGIIPNLFEARTLGWSALRPDIVTSIVRSLAMSSKRLAGL